MGKFIILPVSDGFKFFLKAKNGESLIVSSAYLSVASCKRGIERMCESALLSTIEDQTTSDYENLKPPKFEIYKEKNKAFYFKLRTTDNDIIARSKPYTSKASCMKGIESVKRNAAVFEILEKQA